MTTVFAKYLAWRAVSRSMRSRIREYVSFVFDTQEDHQDNESLVLDSLSPTFAASC